MTEAGSQERAPLGLEIDLDDHSGSYGEERLFGRKAQVNV